MPANQLFSDWTSGDLITAAKLNQMKNDLLHERRLHELTLTAVGICDGRSVSSGGGIIVLYKSGFLVPAGLRPYVRRIRSWISAAPNISSCLVNFNSSNTEVDGGSGNYDSAYNTVCGSVSSSSLYANVEVRVKNPTGTAAATIIGDAVTVYVELDV